MTVSLSNGWIGGAHPSDLPAPTSTFSATNLQSYSDAWTVLYAYSGDHFLAISSVPAHKRLSTSEAADLWAAQMAPNGYEVTSRDAATVDGHAAVRFVSINPGSDTDLAATTDEYVFPVARSIWVVSWSAPPAQYPDAEPSFDQATTTVALGAS